MTHEQCLALDNEHRELPHHLAAPATERAALPLWVPQTYGEALAVWGAKIIACPGHEWDNRTTAENTVWLLEQLWRRLEHGRQGATASQEDVMAQTGPAPQEIELSSTAACQEIQWSRINCFLYANQRGKIESCRVLPLLLEYGRSPYHPSACWQLAAWDLDRNALRHFALHHIHVPG